jgi:acyl dehydratase
MIEPLPTLSGQFTVHVPLEHPSYAGHFPGYPIVPGIVCLDWLVAQYALAVGQAQRVHAISTVKFLAPVLPGDVLSVQYQIKPKANETPNTNAYANVYANANANENENENENEQTRNLMTAITFTSFKPMPLGAEPQKTCVAQILLQSAPRLA